MCRNIETLFDFEPPVTEQEIGAVALQFVRKLCGCHKPSKDNEAAFAAAVDEIAAVSGRMLGALTTQARPRDRQREAAKVCELASRRFGL
jgi:hypothetical protein